MHHSLTIDDYCDKHGNAVKPEITVPPQT